jgi:hypothetical protein
MCVCLCCLQVVEAVQKGDCSAASIPKEAPKETAAQQVKRPTGVPMTKAEQLRALQLGQALPSGGKIKGRGRGRGRGKGTGKGMAATKGKGTGKGMAATEVASPKGKAKGKPKVASPKGKAKGKPKVGTKVASPKAKASTKMASVTTATLGNTFVY